MLITVYLVYYRIRFSKALKDWECLTRIFELHAPASFALRSILKNLVTTEASKLAMELVAELMAVEHMASELAAQLLPKLKTLPVAELADLL